MPKNADAPPRQEFERKFLVVVKHLPELPKPIHLVQGYLHADEPYDRIRVTDGREAVLEYKASDNFESEKMAMTLVTARYLLARYRVGALVEKLRHDLPSPFSTLRFEIDKFLGENDPLWLVELEHPRDFSFKRKSLPLFVGKEVTKDPRFKNRNLAARPFNTWSKGERKSILKIVYP